MSICSSNKMLGLLPKFCLCTLVISVLRTVKIVSILLGIISFKDDLMTLGEGVSGSSVYLDQPF